MKSGNKELLKMVCVNVLVVTGVVAMMYAFFWFNENTPLYAMFGEVIDQNGDLYLIQGCDSTPTENAYWFSFEENWPYGRPSVGQTITIDYGYRGGEPYYVNCWENGEGVWLVVNLRYATPEALK